MAETSWDYFFDWSPICQRGFQSRSLWQGTSLFVLGEAGSWKAELEVPVQ